MSYIPTLFFGLYLLPLTRFAFLICLLISQRHQWIDFRCPLGRNKASN